eukprot:scaffold5408_cov21-Tisochrysis_lutea.AAC.1
MDGLHASQVEAQGRVVNTIELPSSVIKQTLRDSRPLLDLARQERCNLHTAFLQPKVCLLICNPLASSIVTCGQSTVLEGLRGDLVACVLAFRGDLVACPGVMSRGDLVAYVLAFSNARDSHHTLMGSWLSLELFLRRRKVHSLLKVSWLHNSGAGRQIDGGRAMHRTFQVPTNVPYQPPSAASDIPPLLLPPPSYYTSPSTYTSAAEGTLRPSMPSEVSAVPELAFVLHESGAHACALQAGKQLLLHTKGSIPPLICVPEF